MRVKTISTKYERAFNLGDYNSLRLEVSAWADLEEEDNPVNGVDALFALCRGEVAAEWARIKDKVAKPVNLTEIAKMAGVKINEGSK